METLANPLLGDRPHELCHGGPPLDRLDLGRHVLGLGLGQRGPLARDRALRIAPEHRDQLVGGQDDDVGGSSRQSPSGDARTSRVARAGNTAATSAATMPPKK